MLTSDGRRPKLSLKNRWMGEERDTWRSRPNPKALYGDNDKSLYCMPIRPENKSRYPANWKEIRASILKRANNRCEFCGVENHTDRWNEKTGKLAHIVLTVAHLDHQPENCDPENLRALCQACHNRYDAQHRVETRKKSRKGVYV